MKSDFSGTNPKFDSEKLKQAIESAYDAEPVAEDTPSSAPAPAVSAPAAAAGEEWHAKSREDRAAMLSWLDGKIFSCRFRLIFCVFGAILLGWFEWAAVSGYLLPAPVSLEDGAIRFIAADLALLIFCALLCFEAVVSGAAALFTLKPDCDSLCFAAFFGAFAVDVYLLLNPAGFAKGSIMIYSAAAAAILAANLIGRAAQFRRIKNGLLALPETGGFFRLNRQRLPEDGEELEALCPEAADEVGSYIARAFDPSPADEAARILSPILLCVGLLLGVVNLLLGHGFYAGAAAFAASACIGAPVLFLFGQTLPFLRASRRLRKLGALLSGCAAAESIFEAEAAVVGAETVFPAQTVSVHAIKTFNGVKIETAILDAACLAQAVNSPLAPALAALLSEGVGLPSGRVERTQYHDELGLFAVVNGRETLLGARDLMQRRGVEIPTREYEAKYAADGRDIVYLAMEGKLSAMFVVGYYSSAPILSGLKRLQKAGLSVYLTTSDANITPSLLADRLDEDHSSVRILDSRRQELLVRPDAERRETGVFFSGSLLSYTGAVISAVRLRGTLIASVWLQTVGAALGLCLVAFCSLFAGMHLLTPAVVLEYQGVWMLPVLLITLFRKS